MECPRCFQLVEPTLLACPSCHALIYEKELEARKAKALELERNGSFQLAREAWVQLLTYLPPETKQTSWVLARIAELTGVEDRQDAGTAPPSPPPGWVRRLGPLAPIAIALLKGKGLLALLNAKSLLSLGVFAGFYGEQFGFALGAGFAVIILIHELGHYVDIRRRGLPADMPVFLPGLGAYVRWRALHVPKRTQAEVSLAGPLAGACASAICVGIFWITGAAYWASLARIGAWLNILNLVPVWPLDGGQAATVLARSERVMLLTAAVILWIVVGDGVFFLVSAGGVWQLFRPQPSESSPPVAVYFISVLAALAALMWIVPGKGAGI